MAKPTLPSLVIKSTTSWRVEKISKRRDIYPELVRTIATVRASATGVPQHTGVRFINQITIISTYYYCPPVEVRSIVINPSVCASVCLSVASISLEPLDRSARNFVCGSPVAVVRSTSGGVALCYVLPVLWITSRLAVMVATSKGGACNEGRR